jgi:zinc transporter ZupT
LQLEGEFGRIKILMSSKWQAIRVTLLSGLFEPLGVIIVHVLFGNSINEYYLHALFGSGVECVGFVLTV